MNKTGKTSLRAMKKDELLEFCWTVIQHYNEATRRADELQTQINHLERLLFKVREQAGNIRTGEGEQF